MKGSLSLLAFCLPLFAAVAEATEYPLQFTPNAGYRGLVVAGYRFENNEVVGNCSYYTVSSSGTLTFDQTCRWDLSGKPAEYYAGGASRTVASLHKGNSGGLCGQCEW